MPKARGDAAASDRTCFVIGPIGDKLADVGTPERERYEEAIKVFEEVIEPACAAFGIDPIRSDLISQPGEIPEQAFRLLRDADIVIADLTDGNANVMYELGLRHTVGSCTIQVAEHGRIPFDVSVIRTIQFKRTAAGLIDARDELKASLKHCLEDDHLPVTATRVWRSMEETTEQAEKTAAESEQETAEAEPGFLDLLAAMEAALPRAGSLIQQAGAVMQRISDLMSASTQEVHKADARGAGAASARLTIAARLAKQLAEPASEMDQIAADYEKAVADVEPGLDYLLGVGESDPERAPELAELAAAIIQAADATEESIRSAEENAARMAELGTISSTLRRPTMRLAAATRRLAAVSSRFVVWGHRARRFLPNSPEPGPGEGQD